jgi:plastocyanin
MCAIWRPGFLQRESDQAAALTGDLPRTHRDRTGLDNGHRSHGPEHTLTPYSPRSVRLYESRKQLDEPRLGGQSGMMAFSLLYSGTHRSNFTEVRELMGIQLGSGVVLTIGSALFLCGCGKSSTSPSPSSNTATVNIVGSIGNQAYQPNPIPAAVGDKVVFKNNDSVVHHIVIDDGSADLGDVAPGATTTSVSVKSTSQQTFHCKIHPSMVGSVNGQNAPVPPPCVDPYGVACGSGVR